MLDGNGGSFFDLFEGSVTFRTWPVTYGEAYGSNLPYPEERTDYTFIGWNTAANGSGVMVTGDTILTTASDHSLYAQWAPTASP